MVSFTGDHTVVRIESKSLDCLLRSLNPMLREALGVVEGVRGNEAPGIVDDEQGDRHRQHHDDASERFGLLGGDSPGREVTPEVSKGLCQPTTAALHARQRK